MTPKISIILPVYNGEGYIGTAIESMLNQTFSDFELIVIDDGSTDGTVDVVRTYHDPRVRLEANPKNQGLVAVLNQGMALGTGKYLARMDADDISLPERLERQYVFMEDHPEVSFLAANAYILGTDDVRAFPSHHEDIRASLLFYNDIIHSAVVVRRDDWIKHNFSYPAGYPHAEDYGLWATVAEQVQFHNLQEPLLYCRLHEGQVSTQYRSLQFNSGTSLQRELLTTLGVSFTEEELAVHTNCKAYRGDPLLSGWCDKVLSVNTQTHVYDQGALERVVAWLNGGERTLE
ncbi:glycosyltransferase family 2 protein [Alicyclobacillus ferrooxydans]|uniref:glycosyltransferase family 2 protein n=1 Tax=Alicyclobacillus ferrooxydans TaxID=471514 RepID=UPI0006D553A0|nr:glycosyltransferase [Alicyclobacillus ferrooxydans]